MKKFILSLIATAIGLIALIFTLQNVGVQSLSEAVRNFSVFHFVMFIVVSYIAFLLVVVRWKIVLNHMGHRISLSKLMRYHFMGFALSYVTPSMRIGGEPLRAMMLYRHHGVRLSSGASSVILETGIGLTIDLIIGSLLFIMLLIFSSVPSTTKIVGLITLAVAGTITLLFYVSLLRGKGPFSSLVRAMYYVTKLNLLRRLTDKLVYIEKLIIAFLKRKKKALLGIFIVSLAIWPLLFLQFYFAFLSIGASPSIFQAILSLIVLMLTSLAPIPAALGVQEAGQYSLFPSYIGIAVSLVFRIKHSIFALIGLFYIMHEGISTIKFKKFR